MTVLTILNSPGTEIPDLLTELGDREGIELRIAEADTLSQALPGTDVLLMWDFFSTALKDAYGSADRLRWVHAAAAGVDSLLFDELVEAPVTVTNARGSSTVRSPSSSSASSSCRRRTRSDHWPTRHRRHGTADRPATSPGPRR